MSRRNFLKKSAFAAAAGGLYVWNPLAEDEHDHISYTRLLTDAKDGKFSRITVDGQHAFAEDHNGKEFHVIMPEGVKLYEALSGTDVDIWFKPKGGSLIQELSKAAKQAAKQNALRAPFYAVAGVLLGDAIRWTSSKCMPKLGQDEEKAVAYHEAGHALVSYLRPGKTSFKSVTIVPEMGFWGVCYSF